MTDRMQFLGIPQPVTGQSAYDPRNKNDRIEIQNPGPLSRFANAKNFPNQTSYRNPVVAEAMKVLGFVNRYGRGIQQAR